MDQLDLAIHQTGLRADGGMSGLAARMGINQQVLINKCNPNNEQNKLSVREAVAMMLITDDVSILKEIARAVGYEVAAKGERPVSKLMDAVLAADVEHGDVVRAIRDAWSDKRLTAREEASVLREIEEARQALDDLELSVVSGSVAHG